jgi:hypothetical protein
MTPEEMKRLMEFIDRIPAKWIAAEGRMVFEERPDAEETRKTMKELQERLEKLLEHERRKLTEYGII